MIVDVSLKSARENVKAAGNPHSATFGNKYHGQK